MMSAWMIYAVALTALAYFAAVAAEHLMWLWRAPRRLPWLIALGISVSLPLALPILRGVSASRGGAESRAMSIADGRLTAQLERSDAKFDGGPRVIESQSSPKTSVLEPFLFRGWIASSVLGVLVLLTTYARFGRQRAAWREMELEGTRVLVAPDQGPAVVGVWRPRIVIPEWSLSLDVTARSVMMQHEQEHLVSGDPRCLFVAAVALTLFPWNVPLWLITGRLRRAIELDCDSRVLTASGDVNGYGSLLIAFAANRVRPLGLAVGLIERQSLLERRIRVMTASRPRRPLLVSVPLVLGIAVATLGVTRTNVPRSPFTAVHGRVRSIEVARHDWSPIATIEETHARLPMAEHAGEGKSNVRLPHLTLEPPRITVDWENAEVHDVIAAFASFSHRRIVASADVTGFISAHVVDQPWTTALTNIMWAHGFRVAFNPDSSITISLAAALKDSGPSERVELAASSRMITGTVDDAETGRRISDAHIGIVGTQAIGEPNEARTDERGEFSLRGPDGEVWLDACAPGYEFTRVTLSPSDSVASFHGRRAGRLIRDSALYRAIIDSSRSSNRPDGPVFVVDGTVVDAGTLLCPNTLRYQLGRLMIRIF